MLYKPFQRHINIWKKDHPDIKILYGVEAYLAPDKTPCVSFSKNQPLDDTTYCVLDLETTGFSFRTEKNHRKLV